MKNDRRSSSRELACALLGACTASGGDTKALADRGNERGEGSAFPHARSRSRFDGSHDWKFESRTTQGLAGGGVWCSRFIRRAPACAKTKTASKKRLGDMAVEHPLAEEVVAQLRMLQRLHIGPCCSSSPRPPASFEKSSAHRMRLLTMARHQKCWSFRSLLATGRPVLRLLESLFRCHGRTRWGKTLSKVGATFKGIRIRWREWARRSRTFLDLLPGPSTLRSCAGASAASALASSNVSSSKRCERAGPPTVSPWSFSSHH